MKQKLLECNTLNEMWDTLDEHYNFDKKLGFITKRVVVAALMLNIHKLIAAAGIKPR